MSHSSSSTKGNPDNNSRVPPQDVAGAEATFTRVPDSSIPSRDESSSTPPANPPSPSNPISLAPSKGGLDMTSVETNDSRTPYHRLKYLRTCYYTQSIMYYCNSYGLFNEPGTLPMVPNVEDEACALRFSDMAIKVDRAIRELERNAPYPESRELKHNAPCSEATLFTHTMDDIPTFPSPQ